MHLAREWQAPCVGSEEPFALERVQSFNSTHPGGGQAILRQHSKNAVGHARDQAGNVARVNQNDVLVFEWIAIQYPSGAVAPGASVARDVANDEGYVHEVSPLGVEVVASKYRAARAPGCRYTCCQLSCEQGE